MHNRVSPGCAGRGTAQKSMKGPAPGPLSPAKKQGRRRTRTPTDSLRLPPICAGRFQGVCHLFNGYLTGIVGYRVDLPKPLKAACHPLYAVQPLQG